MTVSFPGPRGDAEAVDAAGQSNGDATDQRGRSAWPVIVDYGGADETSFRAGKATHRTSYVTGLVDTKEAFLIDVIEGREAAELRKWLRAQDQQWLEAVSSVAIDLHEGFRRGLRPHLDHATLVADPFHVVGIANRRVDQVRRRVQNEVLGHRGRRDDPLYRIRRILLTGHERLNDSGRKRMDSGLAGGDPKDEVLAAWLAKEAIRAVYLTDDATKAATLLDVAIAECNDSEVPEVVSLGDTLTRWQCRRSLNFAINDHRISRLT